MHQAMPPPPINALLRPRAIALVGVSAKGGAGANILQVRRSASALRCRPGRSIRTRRRSTDSAATSRCASCLVFPTAWSSRCRPMPCSTWWREAAAPACAASMSSRKALRTPRPTRAARGRRSSLRSRAPPTSRSPVRTAWALASLHYRFAATMADIPAPAMAGGISFVSQSGGLLNSFAELTTNRGIGVNYLISSGNEAVLEMADYIEFLADDPATQRDRLHHGGRQERPPLPRRGRARRAQEADRRAQARPQRIRPARHARPYRHACRQARGVRGAVPAERRRAGRFDRRAGRDRGAVRSCAAAAGRPRGDDDGVGRRDLADRRPRRSGRAQLPADRRGDQRAHSENPRRRARLRQSARHGRAAAPAPGRQHHRRSCRRCWRTTAST